jgi:hypothetical protein
MSDSPVEVSPAITDVDRAETLDCRSNGVVKAADPLHRTARANQTVLHAPQRRSAEP